MMLHNGRCGSTVVGNLLAQNPNIYWASELYEPMFKVERRKSARICIFSQKVKNHS